MNLVLSHSHPFSSSFPLSIHNSQTVAILAKTLCLLYYSSPPIENSFLPCIPTKSLSRNFFLVFISRRMSTSSQFYQQADRAVDEKPKWLNLFLGRTFFDACQLHHLSKNKVNKYCIDCNLAACIHCISSGTHVEHKILKIYRHVYKDVVALSDMEKHMDCSNIQPYKCNKQLIIAMNPLPHCGSSSNTNRESSCIICTRRLMDPTVNRHCSIACKVEAFTRKRNNSEPPFLTIHHQSPDEDTAELTKEGERRNRRKGIPHKAPC